jgi:4-amino-4-deoxy-L-arabinose transferase-like glycosyltransferase
MFERWLGKWKDIDPLRFVWDWSFTYLSFENAQTSEPVDMPAKAELDLLGPRPERGRLTGRFIDTIPRSWILGFAALAAVYVITAGIPRLFDEIDGQYAGAAREMIARGDWLIPTQDGVPRLQKPPFVYWCEIISLRVFGQNEFGARLPIAIAAIAWLVATGLVARRVIGTSSAGVAAAITLAAFAGTYFFCHLVMPEAFIGFFVALAFWALLSALQETAHFKQDRWLLAAWIFMGFGALSKGMHALLIPVIAMLATAWIRPAARPVCKRLLLKPQGWLVFLAILAPWYVAVECRYPGFLKDHFFNEQLGPALSRRWPPDSDHVPLTIFWLQHLVLFFPMTLLLPSILRSAWRVYSSRTEGLDSGRYLLVFWFLVNALGISFANVQDYYLMVAWPPVAVLVAGAISNQQVQFKWPGLILAWAGGVGLVASFCFMLWAHNGGGSDSSSRPINQDTIMIGIQSLPAAIWAEMDPLLCSICGVILAGGVLVYFFDRLKKPNLGFSAFALLMAAVFLLCARGLVIVQDEFSSANIAKVINQMAKPESTVIVQGAPNEKTSLFFYLHKTIYWVDGNPELEFATRRLRIGLDHYLNRAMVADKWKRDPQLFLVIQTSDWEEWKQLLAADSSIVAGAFGPQTILLNHH